MTATELESYLKARPDIRNTREYVEGILAGTERKPAELDRLMDAVKKFKDGN